MFVPVPLRLTGWMHSGYPIMAYMSEGDYLNLPKWIGRDNGWGWFHELGKSDRGLFRAGWKVGTTRIGGAVQGSADSLRESSLRESPDVGTRLTGTGVRCKFSQRNKFVSGCEYVSIGRQR